MAHSKQNLIQREELFFMKFLVEELDAKTLPNKGDVLRNYFFLVNRDTTKTNKVSTIRTFQKEIADKVAKKILAIWSGFGIKTTTVRSCRDNLEKLYSDYNQMRKSYKEGMPTERQLVLDVWAEQCELLFFAEERGARKKCEPKIMQQLIDADSENRKFSHKRIPYERLRLRPKTKAKGPEAGPSHAAATDANNNAANDLAISEEKRQRANAKPPGERVKSSTHSTTRHDGKGHKNSKHRNEKEIGPSNSSGDAKLSEADAMRYYAEVMKEVAEYDKRVAELEALEKQLTQDGCDKKDVEVDVKTQEAKSTENEMKKLSVKRHPSEKPNLVVASSVSSKKHAENRPKYSKKLADAETLTSQGDSLDSSKKVAAIDVQPSTSTAHHEKEQTCSLDEAPSISRTITPKLLPCDATKTPAGTKEPIDEDAAGENLVNTTVPDDRSAKWRRYDEELKNARLVLENVSEEMEVLDEQTWALIAQFEKFQPEVVAKAKLAAASSASSKKHAEKRPREANQGDSPDCPKPAAKSPRLDLLVTRGSSQVVDFNSTSGDSLEADNDDEEQTQSIGEVSIVNRTTTPKPRHDVVSPTKSGPVEAVVARGKVDVNGHVPLTSAHSSRKYTALHVAVQLNLLETAKAILDRQADILYIGDSRGTTPLHLAGKLKMTGMIDLLLEYDKFHHDLVDDQGMTHFMCACMSSRPSEVEKFFSAAKSQDGMLVEGLKKSCVKDGPLAGCTPLILAQRFGRQETVDLLNTHFD